MFAVLLYPRVRVFAVLLYPPVRVFVVLLYPPDRPVRDIRRKIRRPGMPLFSQHFADPPKEPHELVESPSEEEKMKQKTTKVQLHSAHHVSSALCTHYNVC